MGASGWDYRVPYAGGLGQSLAAVQKQELAEGGYVWPWERFDPEHIGYVGPARPTSLADLHRAKQIENFWDSGTHTILDVNQVITGRRDQYGAVRLLTAAELDRVFGTRQPSAADFERVTGPADALADLMGMRWTGRCMVIYAGAAPAEVHFWGYSGD
jgi:hypothetical protein